MEKELKIYVAKNGNHWEGTVYFVNPVRKTTGIATYIGGADLAAKTARSEVSEGTNRMALRYLTDHPGYEVATSDAFWAMVDAKNGIQKSSR